MRLAQDTRRLAPARSTTVPLAAAVATRDAASASAAASAAATAAASEAIEGDLIAASPTLANRIAAIEARLDGLEATP